MKFTIFKQGLLLVSVPLLSQLLFIALLAKTQRDNAEADAWSLHTKEVMAQCHALMASVVDAESATRGWVLTNDEQFVGPLMRARREVPARVEQLTAMVQDNPPQVVRSQAIAEQARQLLAWQQGLNDLMRNGKQQAAIRLESEGGGRQPMEKLRSLVTQFLATEEALDAERLQSVAEARSRLNWFLIGGAIGAFGITAALATLLMRGIGRRLMVMIDNAARVSRGQPLQPRVGGSDEITRLDQVFHDMAQALSIAADKERAYTDTLERRVAERTWQLERSNRDLRNKNQENETFVYSVSHDLRSPLVNLQGFSRELGYACTDLAALSEQLEMPPATRERFSTLIERDMSESITFIQTAVTRLSNIIDALLRLSRVGRVEYQWQDVDVEVTVQRVVTSLQSTAQERQATITVAELPRAWGDPTAVEQIFANLIGNALHYLSPDRTGMIEIGLCEAGEEAITYFVRDNGLGIAESHQPKLFKAFQRLHPERAQGEGMGLATVSRIVERHRGRIWVESTVNVGTTFFVALPSTSHRSPDDLRGPAVAASGWPQQADDAESLSTGDFQGRSIKDDHRFVGNRVG